MDPLQDIQRHHISVGTRCNDTVTDKHLDMPVLFRLRSSMMSAPTNFNEIVRLRAFDSDLRFHDFAIQESKMISSHGERFSLSADCSQTFKQRDYRTFATEAKEYLLQRLRKY